MISVDELMEIPVTVWEYEGKWYLNQSSAETIIREIEQGEK
jgi:hypothetical protein